MSNVRFCCRQAGLLKIVQAAFDGTSIGIGAVFDQTPPDSSMEIVKHVAAIYRNHNCDAFIALGGGSCIDTAKGVNIVITEQTEDLAPLAVAEVYANTPREARAERTIERIYELRRGLNAACGLPMTLKPAGVDRATLPQMAQTALNDGALIYNSREVGFDDALRLLEGAYDLDEDFRYDQ